jgi:glycosyltransferase involved in cell wall biosynthesis
VPNLLPHFRKASGPGERLPGPSPGQQLIPLQQLEAMSDGAPGTWISRGVDPQFLVPFRGRAGWFRVRFKMAHEGRARVEIRVDTGNGLQAAECIERTNFTGSVDRHFYVNVPQPVRGFRFDPLDMEGQFRLEELQIRPVSRLGLLGRALGAALRQAWWDGPTGLALGDALRLLLRGRWGEFKKRLLQNLPGPSPLAPPAQDPDEVYRAWRKRWTLTDADRDQMRAEAATLANPPVISVLLPLADGAAVNLRPALESVLRQVYARWELCVAGAPSTAPHAGPLLAKYGGYDSRIKVCFHPEVVGQAAALNAALGLAAGDYVAILGPDDELAEQALLRVAQVAVADHLPDMLYSDEDRLGPDGQHVRPFFKPDWSPEYLLSFPYTGDLSVYRSGLVRELGGFREEFAPAHTYDLVLRIAARSRRIRHLPEVLYHRRKSEAPTAPSNSRQPETEEAGCRALASYLELTDRPGSVEPAPELPVYRVHFAVTVRPAISIIMATAYRTGTFQGKTATYLERCLTSIRAKSTYPNYEILLFDNGEPPAGVLGELARWRVSRAPYARPFNWATTMNQGAARAAGSHLLFLDDDTEVITPDWLECLLEYSQQPDIGAVGARLHLPDGRLQHAGILIQNGSPGHPFYGYPEDHPGYYFSSCVPRNYSAVTGACLMTRAEVFHAVGGLTESFAYYFNDVDYCLKVGATGRRVVCTPHARLYHYETATKSEVIASESKEFTDQWGRRFPADPFYNPNLSERFADFHPELA